MRLRPEDLPRTPPVSDGDLERSDGPDLVAHALDEVVDDRVVGMRHAGLENDEADGDFFLELVGDAWDGSVIGFRYPSLRVRCPVKKFISLVALFATVTASAQSSSAQRARVVRPPPTGPVVRVHRPVPPVVQIVVPHSDPSRAVSKLIPPEGGAVSAVAADGTQFTLTLPAGALVSEEEITLTPVGAIDRLPLSGGLSAAVQVEPEGLLLFQPATLLIESPVPIAAAQEITFAWRGTGEVFFLYPPKPLNTASITLSLTHFSGYGAGRGTSADETAQLARLQHLPEDALAQELQAIAAAERQDARASGGLPPIQVASLGRQTKPSLIDAAKKVLTGYFQNVLNPEQPLKCSDDWRGFLSKLKQFEADVNELTAGDATLLQAAHSYFDSLFSLLAGCYEKDYELCKSNLDANQGVDMYRIYQVVKAERPSVNLDRAKITACLTFRLEFTSFIQEAQFPGVDFAYTHRVSAKVAGVVLSAFSGDPPRPVSDELKYEIHSYVGKPYNVFGEFCTITTDGTSSVFQVLNLAGRLNPFYQNKVPINWLTMKYDPGTPVLITKVVCPKAPVQTLREPRWRVIYNAERHDFSGTIVEADWVQVGTGTFALKSYDPPPDTFQSIESSNLILKHTPQ